MTKAEWVAHAMVAGDHDRKTCPECKARLRTRRANEARRDRYQTMRALGMVKTPYGWE